MSGAAVVTSRVDKHLNAFSKAKVLGGGRDVGFSCLNRRWIYFGFFSSKHITPVTWWECFLVILLEDCRVGSAFLCVWTFHLSARNTGCWPLCLLWSVLVGQIYVVAYDAQVVCYQYTKADVGERMLPSGRGTNSKCWDSPYRAQSKHVAGSSLGSQANVAGSFIILFSWET